MRSFLRLQKTSTHLQRYYSCHRTLERLYYVQKGFELS
jgi:hypothetical protein